MEDDDSDFEGLETKLNTKDRILLNNPEEADSNPFKVGYGQLDRTMGTSQDSDDIRSNS